MIKSKLFIPNIMAKFLAYFDLLGYKKFIENNTDEHLDYRTDHFGRNIERALALDQPNIQSRHSGRYLSDISQSRLNCLTFSDTVVLWTNTDTFQDFEEILKVAFKYNQFNVTLDFPSRGCVVYGDIWYKPFDSNSQRGGRYMLNMIYGRALINAHLRAEAMSWAGCELDISAIEYARTLGDIEPLLQKYTMAFDIPFKENGKEVKKSGVALRLYTEQQLTTQFIEDAMRDAFTQDRKGDIEGRTKVIFDNTIEFLRAHQITFPFCYQMTITGQDDMVVKIFGKLEEDYTHTIIKVINDSKETSYNIEVTQFDRDKSDRNFLYADEITQVLFEEQLNKAKQ